MLFIIENTGQFNMPFTTTQFPGLLIFEPQVHGDSRGYFLNLTTNIHFKNKASIFVGCRIINRPQAMALFEAYIFKHHPMRKQN